MKRRFPRIRTIEPDRAVGFGPRDMHQSPRATHGRSTRWSVPLRNVVLRSALHRRIYVRSTGARHGHHSHEEGNTRLDAVSR